MNKSFRHWWKWHIHTPIRHFFGLRAKTDWISAYSFMAKKMLPYLLDYKKAERQGTPCFDTLEHAWNEKLSDEEMKLYDDERTEKWEHILDEIIFALQYIANGELDDDCYVSNPLYNPNQKDCFKDTGPDERGLYTLTINEDYGKTKIDMDLLAAKTKRVQEGLRLLGEYFMNLWD